MERVVEVKSPQGVIRAADAVYIGQLEGDIPSGHGRMTITRPGFTTILDGSFLDGRMHGMAVCLVVPDFVTQEAEKEGQKLFRGSRFAGNWSHGKRDGQGFMSYADGCTYEGEYKNGLKHGFGVLTWPSGDSFFGTFNCGKADGPGELTFANGVYYAGQFSGEDWRPRGEVCLSFPVTAVHPDDDEHAESSVAFRGGFTGEVPEGEACMLADEKGDVLRGNFSDGAVSGDVFVELVSTDGAKAHGKPERYMGSFTNGKCILNSKFDSWRRLESELIGDEADGIPDLFSGFSMHSTGMTSPDGRRGARDDEGKEWESANSSSAA